MTARGTTWETRDRMSGPPYRQRVFVTPEPVSADAAYGVFVDHVQGCVICRARDDGSSCPEGYALWRRTRAGGAS